MRFNLNKYVLTGLLRISPSVGKHKFIYLLELELPVIHCTNMKDRPVYANNIKLLQILYLEEYAQTVPIPVMTVLILLFILAV